MPRCVWLPWPLLVLVGTSSLAQTTEDLSAFVARQGFAYTDGAGSSLTLRLQGARPVVEITGAKFSDRTYRCRPLGSNRFRCPSAAGAGLDLVSACVSLLVATGRCDVAALEAQHAVDPADPSVAKTVEAAHAKVASFDAKTLATWKSTLAHGGWSDGILLELPPDPWSLVRVRYFTVEAPDLTPRDVVGIHTAVFTPERVGPHAAPRATDPIVTGLAAPGATGTPVPPSRELVDLAKPAVAECHAIASASREIRGTVLVELSRNASGQLLAEAVEPASVQEARYVACLRSRLGVKRREITPGPVERAWLLLRVDPPAP